MSKVGALLENNMVNENSLKTRGFLLQSWQDDMLAGCLEWLEREVRGYYVTTWTGSVVSIRYYKLEIKVRAVAGLCHRMDWKIGHGASKYLTAP